MTALEFHTPTIPPTDGRQFIARGSIVMEDDFGICVEPFAGRVYVEAGELRWAISGSARQCVRCNLEETVHVHAWSPMTQAPVRRIQEAA